eukprot:scaffold243471_cov27-Prasinocladus_malaysianus.AAC.1
MNAMHEELASSGIGDCTRGSVAVDPLLRMPPGALNVGAFSDGQIHIAVMCAVRRVCLKPIEDNR